MTRILTCLASLGLSLSMSIAEAQVPAALTPKPSAAVTPPVPQPAAGKDGEEIPAIIHAGEETTLSSQMAGKVRRISVGLGDQFKAGARLIEFDCSEQEAQLQSAQAEYRGARETHLSRLRLQALGAAGELEVTLAAAGAEKARSQVGLRESQMAYCVVSAPFPGKVSRLRVKIAESVPVGQALVDLVNPSSLKVQLFVPAAWSAWLRAGTAFKVRFNEGANERTVNARVAKLNAKIDGVSQQLEVEGRFEAGSAGLLPGMVGTALFRIPGS